jgi:hypothetical protein
MKTIVETSTNLSKYLLEDSISVAINESTITVGEPAQFIIGDLNSATATLHTSVSNAPEDWEGNKYTFDGTDWAKVT